MPYQEQRNPGDARLRDAKAFAQNIEELSANIWPGARVPGLERIDGADHSGTVHCFVDQFGALIDVQIDSDWWNALGAAHVAAAVLDALQFARSKASMAMLILGRHGHRPALATHPDFASEVAGPPIEVPHVDDPDFERTIEAKIEHGYAVMDAARRIRQSLDSQERRVLSGPDGLFRVLLAGVVVQGAEVDNSLGPYDGNRLAADARAALQAAARLTHPAYLFSQEHR